MGKLNEGHQLPSTLKTKQKTCSKKPCINEETQNKDKNLSINKILDADGFHEKFCEMRTPYQSSATL
jgi:hypothetical protein